MLDMKYLRLIFALGAAAVSILLHVLSVQACTCGAKPDVLSSFENSKNVFIATIEKIEKANVFGDEETVIGAIARINKVYKGTKLPDDIIGFSSGRTSCSATFRQESIGKEFLFYLDEPYVWEYIRKVPATAPRKRFDSMFCGRSASVNTAKEDFKYLDNIEKYKGQTRFSGRLLDWFSDARNAEVRGTRIILDDGNGTIKTISTDIEGYFDIFGLKPGSYKATFEFAKGLGFSKRWNQSVYRDYFDSSHRYSRDHPNTLTFTLATGRHVSAYPFVGYVNSLSGRLLDKDGKPIPGVRVFAVSNYGENTEKTAGSSSTNTNGAFTIAEVPAGDFQLVVNPDDKPTHNSPFRRTFYPGVQNVKDATPVKVSVEDDSSKFIIKVPALFPTIEIKGTLVDKFGRPVKGEWVRFRAKDRKQDHLDTSSTRVTDDKGRFSLLLLKGSKGIIKASEYVGRRDCVEMATHFDEKRITKSFSSESNVVSINGETSREGILLEFPHPVCAEN